MALYPVATYDCLFIGHSLERRFGSFASAELHLFCYLACLLSIYRHRPTADWGYGFVSTQVGAPFSREINMTVAELIRRGLFVESDDRIVLTQMAQDELGLFSMHQIYEERKEYLTAATASVLALSTGIVRAALSEEPELRRAIALSTTRQLLEEPGIQLIYEHFNQLRSALGSTTYDLRIPAVAWLSALFKSAITQS
jgi:hypothetical protein